MRVYRCHSREGGNPAPRSIIKGIFITLEGIDGCGKTTQARMLVEYLKSTGRDVIHTREPGGTAIGGRIRAILLDPASAGMSPVAELMLYSADRAQHLAELVMPALAAGKTVVCDRFYDATVAYQGHARGLDLGLVESLTAVATGGIKPDLTMLLDIPADKALARARRRNGETEDNEGRFEQEALDFHERVRRGYLAIAVAEPARVKVIDADGGVDEVQTRLLDVLRVIGF